MRLRLARIRKKARNLLEELEIQAPPVPVAKLARNCGARIVRVSGNEDDIDGFLYQEGWRCGDRYQPRSGYCAEALHHRP